MKRYKYIKNLLSACNKYALLALHEDAKKAENALEEALSRLRYANAFGTLSDTVFKSQLSIRSIVIGPEYLRIYISLTGSWQGNGMILCIDVQGDVPAIEPAYYDQLLMYQSPNSPGTLPEHVVKTQQVILDWLNKDVAKK